MNDEGQIVRVANAPGDECGYETISFRTGRSEPRVSFVVYHRRSPNYRRRLVAHNVFSLRKITALQVEKWLAAAVEEDDPDKAFRANVDEQFCIHMKRAPSLEMGIFA